MGAMDLWSNWRSSKKTFLSCKSKWRVYNCWRLAQTRPHVYVSHFLRTTEREWCFNRKELCTSFYVCFGLASAICFRKTPKDLHGPIKKDRDTHSNLFGRNVDYWQNEGRDYSSTRNRYSFTSVPGICYKSEKFSVTSSGERISGKDCHFKGIYYFPFKEKITINKSVRVYIRIHRQVLELTKMLGHLTSSILAIAAAKLHCRFVQQQQIKALKKNGSYKSQVLLNKEFQSKLHYWVKNIEIHDGSTWIQLPAKVF